MYGKRVKLRFFFISTLILTFILIIYLLLEAFEKEVVYFLSPTDIKNMSEIDSKKIRVGGMVKNGSISTETDKINFIITDFKNEIIVTYSGAVPNLFMEEKGVVAEGYLKDKNFFIAKKILAKHDENYMPPEVKEAIEDY